MNLAHIHIVLNHIPAFGSLAALMVLVSAIHAKNDQLKKFSFLVLVLLALTALPTYITGAEAQRAVNRRPAVSRAMIQVQAEPVPRNLFLFREFMPGDIDREIGDPYGGPLRIYESVRDEMVESIPSLVAQLKTLLPPASSS